MTPNSTLRIKSMIRSVGEIIAPAVGSKDSLAQEQVKLLMGHLNALLVQAGQEPTIENLETRYLSELAEKLISLAKEEDLPENTSIGVSQALQAGDRILLSKAVENLVSSTDTNENFKRRSWDIVLDFGRNAANRGKEWFKPMGF